MKFWQNVLRALEARHMSVRALALEVGVTPGALSRYSRGSIPSLDVAARIARRLGLSLDSLIWGEGETALPPICEAPGEHDLLRELTTELGMEELLQLAELATQSHAWAIVIELGYCHPAPMALGDICKKIGGAPEHDVRLALLALRKRGIVVESVGADGETLFGVREPVSNFNAREIGDVSQHVKRAVRVLFRDVLPALERQDGSGHLVTVAAKVPREVADKIAVELKELVKNRSRELIANTGTTGLDVLFAVAVSEPPR